VASVRRARPRPTPRPSAGCTAGAPRRPRGDSTRHPRHPSPSNGSLAPLRPQDRRTLRHGAAAKGASVTSEHYTIISADCHAGGSHEMYREYLDRAYLDDFDAWRAKYKNPFSDLRGSRRTRNWDDDLRNGQLEQDGIVGEVIFPNTVPPFFPSFVLFARPPKPSEYPHRLAGLRAHNRLP